MNEPDWTTHITASTAWRRFGIMVMLIPIFACVGLFIAFTALFQFFNVLAQGEPNPHLGRNGRDLGRYATDIIDFLTYNSEKRPFPFAEAGEKDKEPAPKATSSKASPPKATPRKKTTTRKKTGTTRKKTTHKSTASRKKTTTQKTSESQAPKSGSEQSDVDKSPAE